MKQYFKLMFALILGFVAVGLLVGTVGGINDNIQYHDMFSVIMWAVFGVPGTCAAASGFIMLIESE